MDAAQGDPNQDQWLGVEDLMQAPQPAPKKQRLPDSLMEGCRAHRATASAVLPEPEGRRAISGVAAP